MRTMTVGSVAVPDGWRNIPGRAWPLPLDAEVTQTRDLPPELLEGLAEVYVDALRLRDQARVVAERLVTLRDELDRLSEPDGLDCPPIWHHSGLNAAEDALMALVCVVLDTADVETPPESPEGDPEWPATAAPLPGADQ